MSCADCKMVMRCTNDGSGSPYCPVKNMFTFFDYENKFCDYSNSKIVADKCKSCLKRYCSNEVCRYLKIGGYDPEKGIIDREFYEQGYIYKDEEAYYKLPDKVCYIPEISDSLYTRNTFVDICNGDEELATELFYSVNWHHPETMVECWIAEGEWGECPKCGAMYSRWSEDHKPCKDCGAELDYESK